MSGEGKTKGERAKGRNELAGDRTLPSFIFRFFFWSLCVTTVLKHQRLELLEKITGIMRARRGFRVVLNTKQRQLLVAESLQRLVIQVHVSNLNIVSGEGIDVYRESMILGGDLNLPDRRPEHRMVRTMVTKFEFVGP